MRKSLKSKCEDFVINRDILKKELRRESTVIQLLCAYMCTKENKEIDLVQYKLCKKIIKKNTSIFSYFKSNIFASLVARLSLEEKPKERFENIINAYNTILYKFEENMYLPLVAFFISENSDEEEILKKESYSRNILKARVIYKILKYEEHILCGDIDVGLMILIGSMDMGIDKTITDIKMCFENLNKYLKNEEYSSAISQIMIFGEKECAQKCDLLKNVVEQLKDRKYIYSTKQELEVITWLTLLNDDTDDIVDDIIEVNKYLKSNTGYRMLDSREIRQVYSALIVGLEYLEKNYIYKKSEICKDLLVNKVPYCIAQQLTIKNVVEKKGDVENLFA